MLELWLRWCVKPLQRHHFFHTESKGPSTEHAGREAGFLLSCGCFLMKTNYKTLHTCCFDAPEMHLQTESSIGFSFWINLCSICIMISPLLKRRKKGEKNLQLGILCVSITTPLSCSCLLCFSMPLKQLSLPVKIIYQLSSVSVTCLLSIPQLFFCFCLLEIFSSLEFYICDYSYIKNQCPLLLMQLPVHA